MQREAFAKLWPLWLALVPAVLIALNELRKGGRTRVEVVGAGPIAVLESAPPPEGLRFGLEVLAREPVDETARRIDGVLALHPGIVMFGLDLSTTTTTIAKARLAKLARTAQAAATVSVIVGFEASAPEDLHAWWRQSVCRQHRRVRCVAIDEAEDPASVRRALHAALLDGVKHLEAVRATTQVGR